MANIFLSYAHEDKRRAHKLAVALESRGLSVWWDRHIPVWGDAIANYTAQHPADADCVVALWSEASLHSKFVHREAGMAKSGRLVDVIFEPRAVPPSRGYATASVNLAKWDGDDSDEGVDRLAVVIRKILVPSS